MRDRLVLALALVLAATAALAAPPANVVRAPGKHAEGTCTACHMALDDARLRTPAQLTDSDIHHTQGITCAGCHARRFCADCHAGERNARRYHPANFASRHAPEAYSRDVACSGCHSTEAFCRDCHRQTGLAAKTGSRSTRYHNAQPRWLLQHGRAARQELSTCASCHQQSYCMACHSDAGWRVSPHGPTFDAARMHRRNPTLCVRCHLKDPLAGK